MTAAWDNVETGHCDAVESSMDGTQLQSQNLTVSDSGVHDSVDLRMWEF